MATWDYFFHTSSTMQDASPTLWLLVLLEPHKTCRFLASRPRASLDPEYFFDSLFIIFLHQTCDRIDIAEMLNIRQSGNMLSSSCTASDECFWNKFNRRSRINLHHLIIDISTTNCGCSLLPQQVASSFLYLYNVLVDDMLFMD